MVINTKRALRAMQRNISEVYKEAAAAHGAATDASDHVAANTAYRKTIQALSELRKSADRGRSALTLHLQDEDSHVRCWAATHLLPLDELAARITLGALASLPRTVGLNAKMVLREWDAGRLKVP